MENLENSGEQVFYVGVDTGKYLTKMVAGDNNGEEIRDKLLTKMTPYVEEKPLPGISGNVIELNGERYLIGSQGVHNTRTTKKTDVHRLATYTILSRNIPNNSRVNICLGSTLSQWVNEDARKDYIRFMLNLPDNDSREPNDNPIDIEFIVDGEEFKYTIISVNVLPEASGYLLKYDHIFNELDEDVAIVDIGGLNVNGAVYRPNLDNDLEIDMSSVFTLEDGSNPYKTKLRQVLNARLQLGLQERDMERVLRNGYVQHNRRPEVKEESMEVVTNVKNELIEKIVTNMQGMGWNTDSLRFVFIGGGSLLFENEIKNHPDLISDTLIISENAQWDNVEGFALGADLELQIKDPVIT